MIQSKMLTPEYRVQRVQREIDAIIKLTTPPQWSVGLGNEDCENHEAIELMRLLWHARFLRLVILVRFMRLVTLIRLLGLLRPLETCEICEAC